MKTGIISYVVFAILTATLNMPCLRQETGAQSASLPIRYSQVVDQAFEFSKGLPAEFAHVDHRVVVRFLPSQGPEWQIAILWERSRAVRIIRYRLKQGTRPIWQEYNDVLAKNPSASAEQILSHTFIEKEDEPVTQSRASLARRFFSITLPVKMSATLQCLDGTVYELWAQAPSGEVHASLNDCSYGENTESVPVIQWIKAVQHEFRAGTDN